MSVATTGIQVRALDHGDPVDYRGLAQLHDAAWRADNHQKVRYLYDENFFRWLLAGDDWVGVIATDSDGTLVGSVFSFMRVLRCGSESVQAAFSTALAVVPEHRGAGLGRALYDSMRQRVFEERRRSIGIAMFQSGHGGLPTVSSGVRRAANMDALHFHQGKIWSRRFTSQRTDCPALDLPRPVRIDSTATSETRDALDRPILSAQGLACLSARQASIELDPSASFARMYMNARTKRAGMVAYRVGSAAECAITFSLMATGIDNMRLGTIAQLQAFHVVDGARETLPAAIAELCRSMHEHGCIAVTLVDQGYVPQPVLQSLGFSPSSDELVFSLRGSPADLKPFRELQPPYLLDFI